ncbi:MAG: hypothetical protein M3Z04_10420 [Chloroflexota bacterium]|nr:hypothetical protein [Chloroflexota bacterium]
MPPVSCTTARQALETRDFLDWQGLPDACTAHDLWADVPQDLSDLPRRLLGDKAEAAVFVLLDLPGYYRPLASFCAGKLVLFDGTNPELAGGFAPLRANLGEPVARLDWYHGTLPIPAGEWVYPARGITVFVNTTAEEILHIALYRSTSLATYCSSLRPNLRKRLNPRPPR